MIKSRPWVFRRCWWAALTVAGAIMLAAEGAQAQLTVDALDAQRASIEADQALGESVRDKVLGTFAQSIATLREARKVEAEVRDLKQSLTRVGPRILKLKKGIAALEKAAAEPALPPVLSGGAAELQAQLAQKEREVERLQEDFSRLGESVLARLAAPGELAQMMTDRRARIEALVSDLAANPTAAESAAHNQARTGALQARLALREAEFALAKLKHDNHAVLSEEEALRRTEAKLYAEDAERQRQVMSEAVASVRAKEAEVAREEAQVQQITASALPEPARVVARTVLELTEEHEELVSNESQIEERVRQVRERASAIAGQSETTRQRVELVGSSTSVSRVLRRRLDDLPSLGTYRRATKRRQREITRVTDRQIELDERNQDLRNVDVLTDGIVSSMGGTRSDEAMASIKSEVGALLKSEREVTQRLFHAYGRYVTQLTALDAAERDLVASASGFAAYIRSRLVWMQSMPTVDETRWSELGPAVDKLLAGHDLASVLGSVARMSDTSVLQNLALLVVFIVLLIIRRRAAVMLKVLCDRTHRVRSDSVKHTLAALAVTVAAAGSLPLVLCAIGYRAMVHPEATDLAYGVGNGLLAGGVAWFTFSVVAWMCREHGLGDRHFRWSPAVRRQLLNILVWATPILVAINIVSYTIYGVDSIATTDVLGRLWFVLHMAVFIAGGLALLREGTAIGQVLTQTKHPRASLLTARLLLFGIPVVLVIGSMLGYHHTARVLHLHLATTGWALLMLIIARDLMIRMLFIAQRRLQFADALKRREEAREQPTAAGDGADSSSPTQIDVPELSYNQLGEQVRRLLEVGVVIAAVAVVLTVWRDVLPALGVLNDVDLPLTTTRLVDGIETLTAVTLADVGLAILVFALTIIGARNLPGLLEILVLRRLPLDPGGRYAVATLSQYGIVIIGVVTGFSQLGLEWSSIQWLVAALSVGLGFGLQEIVANFISGIILLLERPIRVGDTVTVGDTVGTVSRIQIRATTITSYDMQEWLIPNKEFITGRVVNWTLSDRVNRVIVKVGIAYGADVERAMVLARTAVADAEHALDEPAASVTFDQFGDNSLNLTIRFYLDNLEHRLETISVVHANINRAFAEAGIAIAFPQRDLHVDFNGPLQVNLADRPA